MPNAKDKTTAIHIGWPKTATTSLQMNFLARHPEIFLFGLHGHTSIMMKVMNMIINQDTIDYSQAVVSRLVDQILEAHAFEEQRLVVSNEFFTVTHAPHFLMTDRTIIAQRLRNTFGSVKIFMTVRCQKSMLESMYSQWMKWFGTGHMRSQSYENWVCGELEKTQTSYISMIKYFDVYQLYCDIFGSCNVKVFVYEDILHDSNLFVKKLCRFLNVSESKGPTLFNQMRRNPRLTRLQYYLTVLFGMYPALQGIYNQISASLPEKTKAIVKQLLPERPLCTSLSDEVSNKLFHYFAEGNARLAFATGLDLKKYGYF